MIMQYLKNSLYALSVVMLPAIAHAQAAAGDSSLTFLYNAFKTESDPAKMELLVQKMEQRATAEAGPNTAMLVSFAKSHVAISFAEAGNVEKANGWLARLDDKEWKDQTELNIANAFIETGKLTAAEKILKPHLESNNASSGGEKSTPGKRFPDKKSYEFMYGRLLYKQKDYQNAMRYMSGIDLQDRRNTENTEWYAMALISAGQKDSADTVVRSLLMQPGDRSDEFMSVAGDFFAKQYKKKDYFRQLTDSVGIIKKQAARTKMKEYSVNEPAPDFHLKDIVGKEVSLASLKGKTVIIDFWATWCQPCVASFPGMQRAVDYYRNDPNVVFLFVHTSERSRTATEDAKRLIDSRHYTFNVCMDLKDAASGKNPAADAFNIKYLPTKFIIDPNGTIRFKHTGYVGKAEALDEMTAMVDMANGK